MKLKHQQALCERDHGGGNPAGAPMKNPRAP